MSSSASPHRAFRHRAGRSQLRGRARGIAFILVLWVIAMLSILLGSFAMIARTENLQSRHLFDTTKARYAAEAGLNLAVYELRKNDPLERWVGDGRPYTFGYGEAEIEVRITDDSGKIDLNSVSLGLMTQLFVARGVELDQAERLAASVISWRTPAGGMTELPGAELPDYEAAGLSYGPKNAPFDTVSELQQVLGMSYPLYEKLEPSLTIYSGRGDPSAAFASAETLAAMYPDASPEELEQLIQQRQSMAPGDMANSGLVAPDGTPLMAGGGGLTYSVKSRAKLPNGASTTLDATIRMGGISVGGRPFVILRWRDGETS